MMLHFFKCVDPCYGQYLLLIKSFADYVFLFLGFAHISSSSEATEVIFNPDIPQAKQLNDRLYLHRKVIRFLTL